MPQVGEEVLVTFNRGDVREPYIIGRLWNDKNKPVRKGDADPVNSRVIHTPSGHELSFDDATNTVVIKVMISTTDSHSISLTPQGVEIALAQDAGKISLDKAGTLTLKASSKITLDAPVVEVKGTNINIGESAALIKIG